MSDSNAPTSDATRNAIAQPERRRRVGLGIQSKLLIMLLGVSLISSAIVGAIGFVSGRQSLNDAAFDQLTTIRELRANDIEREFESLQLGAEIDSRNGSAVEAASALIDGFAQLNGAQLAPAESDELTSYYDSGFLPALAERSGHEYASEAFVPTSTAGQYLQYHYTAGRALDDFDTALQLHDAGDGSAWSAANNQYGPFFTGLVEDRGYEDVLLLDQNANVVYSAYKSVDLGVSIEDEPYAGSALTEAYQEVLRSGSLDQVVTTDFEPYLPSLNVSTSWVLSPVGSATNIIGVMAVQVPVDQINDVMTGGQLWQEQGLGTTGEVYLAGEDALMRSNSRLLIEDPEAYRETVTKNGTAQGIVDEVVTASSTVQLQPVAYQGVESALRGETGTAVAPDYTNAESLVAYAPLSINGLNWVIVAHMDADEAFAPVTDFTRNLVLSSLGILLAVSILSLLLAQVFVRPVRHLVTAVRRVAGGDLVVQVPQGSRDEFGDLGAAFNDMAASLRFKQELIDEQRVENDKLMHTLMPQSMADRYKSGEESIAEEHDNVSVVFAELVGFDEHARSLSKEDEIAQLNVLMRGFDEAAGKAGVEKVRSLRGGYLASSGLVQARVDAVRRAVDFAREMRGVLDRFNAQHTTRLELRAGVDTGTVTSGLVARTSLAYDLWGDAVSIAYRVGAVTSQPGIFVSDDVRERLQDSVAFTEVGAIELHGSSQPVWRVDER